MPDSVFSRWRDRRLPVMLALGFAAGVPLPLVAGQVLRQWFTESGLSLGAIGMTALIGLAYANKFLWSPALDALRPPAFGALGRRRGWLLCLQCALIAAIAGIAMTDPAAGATGTVILAVIVAFLSASQDIVIDAYRIEVLGEDDERQAWGLAAYVWGYRLALLASGAGTLLLVQHIGWSGAFLYGAALLGVGLVATALAPDAPRPAGEAYDGPAFDSRPARTYLRDRPWMVQILAIMPWMAPVAVAMLPPHVRRPLVAQPGWHLDRSVVQPFADITRRPYWLWILLFIALFKLGEALAGVMVTPFYRSLGFTREDVATVATVFGMIATLAGALAGSWLVGRIGVRKALIWTGLWQMLSNLMYVALDQTGHSMPMLWAQVGVESFTDGLADAAFLTWLSALTSRSFTATQYALLSSLAAVPLRTLGAGAGFLAEALGWTPFFLLTTAAALPALGIMLFLLTRLPPPEEGPSA
ncbi:AmpG family muropeptide MFS transporter [Roseomonas terrae]|jgi:PAT family beta-lactamase induction signal transducer AmpG|uniref:AmpG family muropeptide MFS transporter n=1 Tax=Neoroseomonas terrae TaxID=424799 RepID=A0ABS5EBC2_9PROT|nr:MFS transporter [Neoroseomonas terrae]MBR0648319.1 AmpG family muropeptide MFS transporter [Neoroseomonas terrae]